MKRLIVSIVMLVFVVTNAMAAGYPPTNAPLPADLRMITSVKALTSYSKEQVAQATANGWSTGIVLPGGTSWAWVSAHDDDIRVITQLLAKEKLSYSIGDPRSQQFLGANLMDNMGYVLFQGQNSFYLEQDGDGWKLPAGAANVKLRLNSYVPISIPGVNNAQAVVTDRYGNQQYVWINTYGDRMFFPTSLCGFSGQIRVTVGQNTGVYDLGTGNNVPPTPVSAEVQATIDGLMVLDDPMEIVFDQSMPVPPTVPKAGGGADPTQTEAVVNPIYQVGFTSPKVVSVYATAPNGEVATSLVVRKVGETMPAIYIINEGEMSQVAFTEGIYDVWFVFPTFGADEPMIPPYGGGGMG